MLINLENEQIWYKLPTITTEEKIKQIGLTKEKVAELLGMRIKEFSRYLNGTPIPIKKFKQLKKVLMAN